MNKKLSQQQLSRYLAIISLILWLVSLCLIGFDNLRGYDILVFGIFFGWEDPNAWTVYSNIFYIFALCRLLLGFKPHASILIMSMLGSMLIIEMLGNELMARYWGWGAILVLFAQYLLVISALLVHQKISIKSAYKIIGVLMLPIVAMGCFSIYQRNYASDWEHKIYFPYFDVAFTNDKLSGLPYKPLTQELPDNVNIEVQFIGDIATYTIENENAYPYSYWYKGKFWRKYDFYLSEITKFSIQVTNDSQNVYRLVLTKPKSDYYLYTLYDMEGNIIFQKPLDVNQNSLNDSFLPHEIQWAGTSKKERALLWQSEKGKESCQIKQISTNPNEVVWQLDKNQIKLFNYSRYKRKVITYFNPDYSICSDNYLLTISYRSKNNYYNDYYSAILFERKTGLPVAIFMEDYTEYTPKVTKENIQYFKLVTIEKQKNEKDKSYLILRTDKDNIKLPLSYRQQKIYQ